MENDNLQPKKFKKKRKHISAKLKKFLLIVFGVILLAGLSFGGWKFYEHSKVAIENKKIEKEVNEFNEKVRKVENEASAFILKGESEKAIDLYDSAINNSDDPDLIYTFEIKKIVILLNLGHNEFALSKMLELEKTNKTEDLYQLIASIYYNLKDYENSIKYYQKAIENADKTHIDNTQEYSDKIIQIEELKSNG